MRYALCRNYFIKLFMKIELNQAFHKRLKTVDGIYFIGAVCDNRYSGAFCDAHRENAEQAFCADAAVILLDPNGAFERVSLLNEECCGSCMQTNAVFYCDVA